MGPVPLRSDGGLILVEKQLEGPIEIDAKSNNFRFK